MSDENCPNVAYSTLPENVAWKIQDLCQSAFVFDLLSGLLVQFHVIKNLLQGGHPKQPDNDSKRSWKHPAHNTAVGVRSLRVKRAVFLWETIYYEQWKK